jgi:hypothetical protein
MLLSGANAPTCVLSSTHLCLPLGLQFAEAALLCIPLDSVCAVGLLGCMEFRFEYFVHDCVCLVWLHPNWFPHSHHLKIDNHEILLEGPTESKER